MRTINLQSILCKDELINSNNTKISLLITQKHDNYIFTYRSRLINETMIYIVNIV